MRPLSREWFLNTTGWKPVVAYMAIVFVWAGSIAYLARR